MNTVEYVADLRGCKRPRLRSASMVVIGILELRRRWNFIHAAMPEGLLGPQVWCQELSALPTVVLAREEIERWANTPLPALMAEATRLRDLGHGSVVSYSRKVFIPLTRLCRDT